jgi:ABC-type uncharacterized transport system substrate-binding protein
MADENDPEAKARFSEFMKELAELGWTDGRNLQIDIRRAGANADRARVYAKELVALQPDVLVAQATAPTAALQQETKTIDRGPKAAFRSMSAAGIAKGGCALDNVSPIL